MRSAFVVFCNLLVHYVLFLAQPLGNCAPADFLAEILGKIVMYVPGHDPRSQWLPHHVKRLEYGSILSGRRLAEPNFSTTLLIAVELFHRSVHRTFQRSTLPSPSNQCWDFVKRYTLDA